jgi:hypothetical protein
MARPAVVLAVLLASLGGILAAEDQAAGLGPRPWRLEAVELRDGRRLEGLVLSGDGGTPGPDDGDIEFVQIVRPAGRPMVLIGWPPFPAVTVRFVERLPEAAHRELAERVEAFRAGTRQEAAAALRLVRADEHEPWRYDGPEFRLASTAEATLTREAILRLELVLGALATLIPPVVDPAEADLFEVRLCGAVAEYRLLQQELGLQIENPACYLPGRQLLIAGSELSSLLAQRRAADDLLDAAAQKYAALDELLDGRIRRLAADLEAQGTTAAKRAEIVRLARQRWSRERGEATAGIEAARRENASAVAVARRTFDARLAHEAWHAYADRRLRGEGQPGLPAWLDEGLAQVVETAPIEAGEVRLDAPDPDRLSRLQELLRVGDVPPVADIITGGQAAFVAGHAGGEEAIAYLAAWGLALDLAIVRPVLSVTHIRDFSAAGERQPLERFETVVGMPVDQYDLGWRQRMQALRPRAAALTSDR